MNSVIIIGRMATDPEAFTTQSGISRSSFKVAVQRDHKNQNGTYDADFLPVVAWRQAADYVNKYLRKGSRIAVNGSIQTRSYDAQDGSKRYVTEIIADRVDGLGDPNRDGQQTQRQVAQQAQQAQQGANDFTEVDDDSLPFD